MSTPIKVYKDRNKNSDYELAGYKGKTKQEAGVVYTPYIPVMQGTRVKKLSRGNDLDNNLSAVDSYLKKILRKQMVSEIQWSEDKRIVIL